MGGVDHQVCFKGQRSQRLEGCCPDTFESNELTMRTSENDHHYALQSRRANRLATENGYPRLRMGKTP